MSKEPTGAEAEEFGAITADGHVLTGTLEDFRRLATALLHAASDMAQARAACDLLDQEMDDRHKARALETAIVVCYARAFTTSTLRQLDRAAFAPATETPERQLHDRLLKLRHKVYAHTDEESGRSIEQLRIDFEGDVAHVHHVEAWVPLPREMLDPIRALCDHQAERLRLEGVRLLNALSKVAATESADD